MRLVAAEFNHAKIPFNAENQHIRCFAHIINLTAQDFLKYLKSAPENEGSKDQDGEISIISKLWKVVSAIQSSPQRRERFEAQCKAHDLIHKLLTLDVITRWNSTYDMIVRALEFQLVSNLC